MRVSVLGLGALMAAAPVSAAHAAPPPISAYGTLPGIESVQISPSGRRYADVATIDGKRYVLVRSADDGKVLQTVDTNGHKMRGLNWGDDDHLLIVFTGTYDFTGSDKYELPVVMLVNLNHHRLDQLIPGEDGLESEPLAVTEEHGHAYGYFLGTGDSTHHRIDVDRVVRRVDLDSRQMTTAAVLPPRVSDVAVGPDGKVLARVETSDEGQDWQLLAGLDSRRVFASGRSAHDSASVEAFGRTPDTILFHKPDDGEFDNPREVNLGDGKIGDPLVQGAAGSPIRDRKTRLLIGFHIPGREPRNVFFDPDLQARWEGVKAAFPNARTQLESMSDDRDRWIVHSEGDHDAGHFYLVDLKEKKAIPLGADYPDVPADQVAAVRWFDYTAQDGTKLQGVLTLPPGRDPRLLPVVVLPHGGPAAHDTVHFDWWAQAIASRGYAVFQPNYRGSTGYGRAFERAGWGQWGKLMQTDVSDGLRALEAQGIADPKRACIVGWSYGGYATLAGITLQNGLYRCAAAGGAVSDLGGMLSYEYDHAGGSRSPTMRYWKASMAVKGPGDPAAAAVSPARMANRADAPLLLIHGKDDTVVPFSQAQEMLEAMRRAGKPVELKVLTGEDHWLSGGKTRTEMLEAMVGFLEKYNPPDGAPPATRVAAVASGGGSR